jgi:SAM-dependent methyltransferase
MSAAVMPSVPLYDQFSDYDRFVNWERRLAYELPFIEAQLSSADARRVLDAACGTGRHALALAERGYSVVGTDLSASMIERARENARGMKSVAFLVAGFGQLEARILGATSRKAGTGGAGGRFDALLCLGNSLPHALTVADLRSTLADFAAVLRSGGLVLIQIRNMDAVVARRERWMPLQQRAAADGREWLFVRFYDFVDDLLTFNVVTLERKGEEPWREHVHSTRLYPWRREQLVSALGATGFVDVTCYGDMAGGAFDELTSGNLVLAATRA